ncbi:MAG: glutamate dehydrogenase (NAD(P)+) [Oceanicoccus sp.]|jgi:glutamate dehydrogenase (NAD(P)+)
MIINENSEEDFYRQLALLQESFDNMQAELEITVRDPALNVEGYVVVWNTGISAHGPLPLCGKGGTRIREGLNLDEVKMLARTMAIKNAAAGLPLGGSKSGLNADPKAAGFEKKYRKFVKLCEPYLHENGGIFGGFGFDIGAAPEHAIWACDTLNSRRSFTGKTAAMGGTNYDEEGIAGLGVAEAASTLIELGHDDVESMTFAVHGVGAMGAAVSRYFCQKGARLAAIGDPKYGGTWQFERLISQALINALIEQNIAKVQTLLPQEGSFISKQANEVLFQKVDVLFPCALHNVITTDNVSKISARYLVEGANSPCTIEAYPLLYQQGVELIPDFIANCGGVIAAFIELTSAVSDEQVFEGGAKVIEAKTMTQKTIRQNVSDIVAYAKKLQLPLRDVGMYIALTRVLHKT